MNKKRKKALDGHVAVRQRLQYSLQTALQLVSEEHRGWLTGSRRLLLIAQTALGEKGIDTRIVLRRQIGDVPLMDDRIADWSALAA